jgi:hypothetical protein
LCLQTFFFLVRSAAPVGDKSGRKQNPWLR